MAGKYNIESSDDGVKDRRERHGHHISIKVELNRSRRNESDSSDSDKRNIKARYASEDGRMSDDRDRSRTNRRDSGVEDDSDRYRSRSNKKVVELDNQRSRRDERDSSHFDRKNRNERLGREDDRITDRNGRPKNRNERSGREDVRITDGNDRPKTDRKDLTIEDEKRQHEHLKRKVSHKSSDADGKQVEREIDRRDRQRIDRREVRHRQQESPEVRIKEFSQGSDGDDKQMRKEGGIQEKEKTHKLEHDHRGRETEKNSEVRKSERNYNEVDKHVEGERSRKEREEKITPQPENVSRRKEPNGRDKSEESDQSSDEDDKRRVKRRDTQKRERRHRPKKEDKSRDKEPKERDKIEDSDQSSDEEDNRTEEKRDRQKRDRAQRPKNGHNQRDTSEDEDDRDGNKKYEQQSERSRVDNYWRRGHDYRRDKKKNENEENREQTAMPIGNLNTDTKNTGKSGGVYIPPFKLARMMKEVEDKSSIEYQRLTWDALRKSINGLVNKVNAMNTKNIIPELFAENLIRGRGLFCRSCMKSQMASPGFTDVFAALVAVVNTKFPQVGDLLLKRIILQLKRAYKWNDKPQLLAVVKFIAHLVNQQVAHEIIALELLTLLLEKPTDDSVEVAVGFVTECGSILQDLSPKGLHGIFERFRGILHEGEIDKRVQFLIEGLFAIRKAKFVGHPAVRPELDLVEQEDQFTHEFSLAEEIDPETALDIFKPDPQFIENEKRYEEWKKSIIGEDSDDEKGADSGSEDENGDDDSEDDEDDDDDDEEEQMQIKDETETNLVNLRRTIYLTIMSSVDFEEAGHKLVKIRLEPGQEMELCIMLLECCSQERTYLRYYGLLAQRFCMINRVHQENFEKCFVQQYSMIHRLETNKLRNVAKFFAHLIGTDALPWHVLEYINLTEENTSSSSRIFIKILFQELSEHLGIRLLNERLSDPTMQSSFDSIFPKDNPKNTRFAINFFTSIGLGGITENLREYLKNMPRLIMEQQKPVSDSESSNSSSSESDSESSRSSSSDESDRGRRNKKRKRRG